MSFISRVLEIPRGIMNWVFVRLHLANTEEEKEEFIEQLKELRKREIATVKSVESTVKEAVESFRASCSALREARESLLKGKMMMGVEENNEDDEMKVYSSYLNVELPEEIIRIDAEIRVFEFRISRLERQLEQIRLQIEQLEKDDI